LRKGLTRRRFIRGRNIADAPPIRPPWSLAEQQFLSRCTRCGDCVGACGEKIVVLDNRGLPEINFGLGACTFCGECANACTPGALRRPGPDETTPPWSLDIRFGVGCLERQRITCRVCGEGCEQEAISFRPGASNGTAPRLDHDRCNGCGACLWLCPVNAVTIEPRRSGAAPSNEFQRERS